MASVNFLKCKGAGSVKAIMRHCDEDERQQHRHSNPDIDLTATASNESMKGLNYGEACREYDRRIDELDASSNRNKRKDRVTALFLDVPAPDGLPESREGEWFRRVWELTGQQYGQRNMVEGYIHRDERHEYIDPLKGVRTSRTHMHMCLVPEIDGQLDGKHAMSRGSMVKLNKSIHEMTRQEFGLDFMTGEKAKSRGSVEDMKDGSLKELRKRGRQVKQREQAAIDKQRQLWEREQAIEPRERAVEARERAVEAREAKVARREAELPRRATEAAREAIEREWAAAEAEHRKASKERAARSIGKATGTAERVSEKEQQPGKMPQGYIPGL